MKQDEPLDTTRVPGVFCISLREAESKNTIFKSLFASFRDSLFPCGSATVEKETTIGSM
jgi:hypothetical protein